MIAGIIGATGYAGAELVRLLSGHPKVEGLALASVSYEGRRIEEVYPNFLGALSAPLKKPEEVIASSDLVFAALPSGVGEPYAQACQDRGISFIDLSADFRFDDDEATFRAWYGKPYGYPQLRKRSVYGLPELNREKIKALAASGPVIIGNPGCYPTGASLGAFPALAAGLAGPGRIIVDAASGVTGGGREPSPAFHYPECADSLAPYKVGAHRHTPEISRNFRAMAALAPGAAEPAAEAPALIFTPHLAPLNRGILSTIYIPLREARRPGISSAGAPRPPAAEIEEKTRELRDCYADFYREEPFVRVLPPGTAAATGRVRLSNFCDISVHLDQEGSTLIVVTAIDNMVKGAAGQAVENMNILLGFDETAGLGAIPASF
ncbi:MAG: N-acetyl-gamma-glutamyl-phosphate reductase [Treponema sp.]|jgi:N-acetyl-gamma-glutamyl-phosphate reductase|nr:N-acetyl-gamma-glutamyl-phosphate reductase [Treponema sp.]